GLPVGERWKRQRSNYQCPRPCRLHATRSARGASHGLGSSSGLDPPGLGASGLYMPAERVFNTLPSAKTTTRMLPPGLPFLSGSRLTLTSSPGLNESLLQPFPIMLIGA